MFEGTVSIHNSFFLFLFMKWKGMIAGSRIIYIQLFTTTAFTRLACYSTCNQCMHTHHRGSALSSLTCQLPSRMFYRTLECCNSASKTLVGSVEPFHVHKSMLSMVLAELSKSCSSYWAKINCTKWASKKYCVHFQRQHRQHLYFWEFLSQSAKFRKENI